MILSENRIFELQNWLNIWDDTTSTEFPSKHCTCEACCFVRDIGIEKRPVTSTRVKIILRKALTLHERFGQCDLDLLKELYEKEIIETNG